MESFCPPNVKKCSRCSEFNVLVSKMAARVKEVADATVKFDLLRKEKKVVQNNVQIAE